eukprot:3000098-Pyramimonas_sp.AAC.1
MRIPWSLPRRDPAVTEQTAALVLHHLQHSCPEARQEMGTWAWSCAPAGDPAAFSLACAQNR